MKWLKGSLCVALLFVTTVTFGCEWAVGYFYQVSCLRGRVVGTSSKWINWSRGWRQRQQVANAKISLYKYAHPWLLASPVSEVKTDKNGWFDFGTVPTGHYTMRIDGGELADYFDVEVTDSARNTKSVLIDISPVTPDCKGGHELIVTK